MKKKLLVLMMLAMLPMSSLRVNAMFGYDVSTEIDNGNVLVKSGSKLRIKNGAGGVVIKNGFECEIGAELVVE